MRADNINYERGEGQDTKKKRKQGDDREAGAPGGDGRTGGREKSKGLKKRENRGGIQEAGRRGRTSEKASAANKVSTGARSGKQKHRKGRGRAESKEIEKGENMDGGEDS